MMTVQHITDMWLVYMRTGARAHTEFNTAYSGLGPTFPKASFRLDTAFTYQTTDPSNDRLLVNSQRGRTSKAVAVV
jgi:hypothetical protein